MTSTSTPDASYQTFATLSEYKCAIDLVIASAKVELLIFDTDLQEMSLDDASRISALSSFLAASTHRHLRILLRDATYLTSRAARMQRLLRDFSAQIEIRVAVEAKDDSTFICNDSGVCLLRPHYQHLKSILTLEDKPRWRLLHSRFSILFDAGEASVAPTQLGL
ncbi:hypothetical protein [Sulfuriferula nivalis]|uniref:DUF7931 domain-containing protein n=1 Tax=Sulfuriferula nivalis TaxID=2675298 RepID=A0A809S7C4_9PROT|nr:hypothetical protein [Sulfuriferula nivalis]BBO99441.1 hypothetical protein SFSGTM_01500 [Sulfuriferula nivalis]